MPVEFDEKAEALALQLGTELQQRHLIAATAESCTGGWIAQTITAISGSSAWFDCGFVTYSNHAKQRLLDVPKAQIEQFGAVSEEVVHAMAEGAVANSLAQVSVAVSGIAGPDGGSPAKPVGTVWLAWKVLEHTSAEKFVFQGDRTTVRQQAVETALQGLITRLEVIKC